MQIAQEMLQESIQIGPYVFSKQPSYDYSSSQNNSL